MDGCELMQMFRQRRKLVIENRIAIIAVIKPLQSCFNCDWPIYTDAGARAAAGKLGFVRLVQGNREGDSRRNKHQIGLSIAANIAQCKNKLGHLAMARRN